MTITPFLWFDTQAEEAMTYYASVFERSRITAVHRAQGRVLSVEFELEGQRLMALNGGPHYTFTPAISLFVSCETQSDIDRLWDRFIADGGVPNRCGWLNDKFGLSWQIVPRRLYELMEDPDPVRATAATEAMLRMRKIVVAELEAAADAAAKTRAAPATRICSRRSCDPIATAKCSGQGNIRSRPSTPSARRRWRSSRTFTSTRWCASRPTRSFPTSWSGWARRSLSCDRPASPRRRSAGWRCGRPRAGERPARYPWRRTSRRPARWRNRRRADEPR